MSSLFAAFYVVVAAFDVVFAAIDVVVAAIDVLAPDIVVVALSEIELLLEPISVRFDGPPPQFLICSIVAPKTKANPTPTMEIFEFK